MGEFLANAQTILDAKYKMVPARRAKGAGGGAGEASALKLVRVPQDLLSQVDRVHDVRRKEIQGMPISCHFTEMKGGAEQPVDPDAHLYHEFKIRRIKKFVQDWTGPSRGLFRFQDKDEEEKRDGYAHTYQFARNKREKRLIQLILKILVFYGAITSLQKPHYYRLIKEQAAFFDEMVDTLACISHKSRVDYSPIKRLTNLEIDRLLYS